MAYRDTVFSRDHRYSIGIDDQTGQPYLSIPVSSGVVDYEEYYLLDAVEYEHLLREEGAAVVFAESCRNRERDDRLIHKPGWNRGTPV